MGAYNDLMTTGETLRRMIANAKSQQHPLNLDDAVIAKLVEAQQAIYAAQRLIEGPEKIFNPTAAASAR